MTQPMNDENRHNANPVSADAATRTDDAAAAGQMPRQGTPRPLPEDAMIIVPVRNVVLFPGMVFPLTIGRDRSRAAVQEAVRLQRPLGVVPPRLTHVVLADQTEFANGYATPLPYDTIVIYTVWPSAPEFVFDDWLRLAFTHEFTHIVHLDRSEGWARIARGIFGRTPYAFPNLYLPPWQIEGLATYEESAITGEGRLHAGEFRAIVREAARSRTLEPLDGVGHVRGLGMLAAVEVVADKATKQLFPAAIGMTQRLTDALLDRGLYTRVAMDCVCIAPPLVTSDAQIDRLVGIVGDAVSSVVAEAVSLR